MHKGKKITKNMLLLAYFACQYGQYVHISDQIILMFLNTDESKATKSCAQQLRGCGSDRGAGKPEYRQRAVCFFHGSCLLLSLTFIFRGYFLLHILVMC